MNLIGRESEKTFLRNFLKSKHRLLQVYGQPSVGKTCLVTEILNEMKSDFPRICYKVIRKDWPKKEFFCPDERFKTLLVADNFQNIFGKNATEDFDDFCEKLITWNHVKVILILSGPSEMKRVQGITLHLKPLQYFDSLHLVEQSLPANMKYSRNLKSFCSNFCNGVPGRIVSLCDKLSECPAGTSSSEILDFLQESQNVDNFLPHQFHESFKEYLQQLSTEQQQALSELSYFPGRFSLHDIMAMTNCKREQQAKFNLVYPLMKQGLIKPTNNSSTEFVLPQIVHQHCQNHMTHISHENCTRLKFNHIIGEALIKAEKINDKGLIYNVAGILDHKWENFAKLILEAIHSPSDGETFEIYCKVAVEARSIINLCYPEAATEFFKAILDASKKLGTEKQKALLMVSYGHSLQSRSSLAVKEAQWHFKSALRILQNYGCDYQCLLIYNYMSLNYYRQGKLEKGIRAAEKALETTVFDRDRADVEHAKIYSYVHLTHNLIFAVWWKEGAVFFMAGNHSKAGQVLHEQLTLVGESGHPAVCYMLNNVGLNIERSGGLPNLALQFYLSSLFSKRSISCVQEHILVPTLCNVAGQFSKNKLRHDLALNFLHEAKEIRTRTGWVHPYTALVMWNIGMVTMRKGCCEEALPFLCEANSLYNQVHPNHYVNAEVKIWLAHCLHLVGDKSEAERVLLEALVNKDRYLSLCPQSEAVSCTLEHLVRLNIGNRQKCQEYLTKLHSELLRLHHFHSISNGVRTDYKELYHWYIKIENNLKRNLPFRHDLLSLPFTCLACKEVIKFKMTKEEIYVESLCNINSQNVSTEHSAPYGLPPSSPEYQLSRSQYYTARLNEFRNIASDTDNYEHDRNMPKLSLLLNSVSLTEDRGESIFPSSDPVNQTFTSSSQREEDCLRQDTTLPNVSLLGSLTFQSFSKRQAKNGENFSSVLCNPMERKSEGSLVDPLHFDTRESSFTRVKPTCTLLLKNIEENGYDTTLQLDALKETLRSLGTVFDPVRDYVRQCSMNDKKSPIKHQAPDPLKLLRRLNSNSGLPSRTMGDRDHNDVPVTNLSDTPSAGFGALVKRNPTPSPDETFDDSLFCSNSDLSTSLQTGRGYSSSACSWFPDKFGKSGSSENDRTWLGSADSLSSRGACQHDELFQTDKKHSEQSQSDQRDSGLSQTSTKCYEQFMTEEEVPELLKRHQKDSRVFPKSTNCYQFMTGSKGPEHLRHQEDSRVFPKSTNCYQFMTGSKGPEQLLRYQENSELFQKDTRCPEQMLRDQREFGQVLTDTKNQRHLVTCTKYSDQMPKGQREFGQVPTDTEYQRHSVTHTRYTEQMQRESGHFQADTGYQSHLATYTKYPEQMPKDQREFGQVPTDTGYQRHSVTHTRYSEQMQRESGHFQADTGYQSHLATYTKYPELMPKDQREFGQVPTDTGYQRHSVTHTRYPEQMPKDQREFRQCQTDTGYQSHLVMHTRYSEQMQRESGQFQTDTGYQSHLATYTRYPEQMQRESGHFQTDTGYQSHLATYTKYPELMPKDQREFGQVPTDTGYQRHSVTHTRYSEQMQRESGHFQADTGYQSHLATYTKYPEQMPKDQREFRQCQTDTGYQSHLVMHTRYSEQMQRESGQVLTDMGYQRHSVIQTKYPEQMQRESGHFQTDTGYQSHLATYTRYPEQMQRESGHFQTDTGYQSHLATYTRHPEQSQTVRRQPTEHEDSEAESITPNDS
ncbi:uncharacterized protein LOC115224678 isoform X2 [Octopus sinensis]|uniref:Uncharacterized protein LOC115224678 isoform X2 n=1 Tax=Octopus sinensis TaxID=2607531 RepID=A0A7E6FQ95_9MOLL|nr:uncharacterized protein LOC115224678 isoform X2 [Octopus sinensis]